MMSQMLTPPCLRIAGQPPPPVQSETANKLVALAVVLQDSLLDVHVGCCLLCAIKALCEVNAVCVERSPCTFCAAFCM